MLCKHAKVLVEVEPLDDVSAGTNTGGAFLPAHGAFSGISGLGLGRWPVHSINKCLDCTGHLTEVLCRWSLWMRCQQGQIQGGDASSGALQPVALLALA